MDKESTPRTMAIFLSLGLHGLQSTWEACVTQLLVIHVKYTLILWELVLLGESSHSKQGCPSLSQSHLHTLSCYVYIYIYMRTYGYKYIYIYMFSASLRTECKMSLLAPRSKFSHARSLVSQPPSGQGPRGTGLCPGPAPPPNTPPWLDGPTPK